MAHKPGPRDYLDDALTAIYLGPQIHSEYKEEIMKLMKKRPIEIKLGHIKGYELSFKTIQEACPYVDCERIVERVYFDESMLYDIKIIKQYLGDRFNQLITTCNKLAEHPNLESINNIMLSMSNNNLLEIMCFYKFRNISQPNKLIKRYYYNSQMELVKAE